MLFLLLLYIKAKLLFYGLKVHTICNPKSCAPNYKSDFDQISKVIGSMVFQTGTIKITILLGLNVVHGFNYS